MWKQNQRRDQRCCSNVFGSSFRILTRVVKYPRMLARTVTIGLAICCGILLATYAEAQTFTAFVLPAGSDAHSITKGPDSDGALWFTDVGKRSIGRMTTSGAVTLFPVPDAPILREIVLGSDGALWFSRTGSAGGQSIGRLDPFSHAFAEFALPNGSIANGGMAPGPDGNIWFTIAVDFFPLVGRVAVPGGAVTIFQNDPNKPVDIDNAYGIVSESVNGIVFTADWHGDHNVSQLGRITLDGVMTVVAAGLPRDARNIIQGPDGALWFTTGAGKVGRFTGVGPGSVTLVDIPGGFRAPVGALATGQDGALWLTSADDPNLRRITAAGNVTGFSNPTGWAGGIGAITSGSDGNIWFTTGGLGGNAPRIWRMIPPPSDSPLLAAVLPASRSVQVGTTVATVFTSILNNGPNNLQGCGIAPVSPVPAGFSFQATDPLTNALVGTRNALVSIAAGTVGSFLLAFDGKSGQISLNVQFGYFCNGAAGSPATASANPAGTILGVNTVLLTLDKNPVPDMIAVGLTPSNDGYSRTGGDFGTGIFVIAATDIGSAASLTARVRLSDPTLKLTATICETNPQSGQCKATSSATVTRTINKDENTTWTAFLTAAGPIAQDAAHNRVYFEFVDSSGVIRGSTSTAVTTK